jgi:hypothetical protein
MGKGRRETSQRGRLSAMVALAAPSAKQRLRLRGGEQALDALDEVLDVDRLGGKGVAADSHGEVARVGCVFSDIATTRMPRVTGSALSRRVDSHPSSAGGSMSIRITSGRDLRANSSASRPDVAARA